jgi:hypothetical protein
MSASSRKAWGADDRANITSMTASDQESPACPKCGGNGAKLCGQSLEYGPEEWLGQTLKERELQTLAYQCDCGMAFTQTIKGGKPPGSS